MSVIPKLGPDAPIQDDPKFQAWAHKQIETTNRIIDHLEDLKLEVIKMSDRLDNVDVSLRILGTEGCAAKKVHDRRIDNLESVGSIWKANAWIVIPVLLSFVTLIFLAGANYMDGKHMGETLERVEENQVVIREIQIRIGDKVGVPTKR